MFHITSLGSDPEFILNHSGKPISAIGLASSYNNVKAYADNVLMEVNHQPFTPSEFVEGIRSVVDQARTIAAEFRGATFTIGQCEGLYDDSELTDPKAHEIGCDPFSNAYNLAVNVTPVPYTSNTRYAGGHLHIGYNKEESGFPPHLLVQLLDQHLLPLDPNNTSTRARFYGAKGSFRDKSYGLEYRSLSNWWLDQPETVLQVVQDIESHINQKYYGA